MSRGNNRLPLGYDYTRCLVRRFRFSSKDIMDRDGGVDSTPSEEERGAAAPPSAATSASTLKAVDGPEGRQLRSRRYHPFPPSLGSPAGEALDDWSGWPRKRGRRDHTVAGSFDGGGCPYEDEDDDECALIRRPGVLYHCNGGDGEGWCAQAPWGCSSGRFAAVEGEDSRLGSRASGSPFRLSYEQTLLLMEGLYAVSGLDGPLDVFLCGYVFFSSCPLGVAGALSKAGSRSG